MNLSQHLKGVHCIGGQERKQFIHRGIVDTEVMTTEPQYNIEKHIVFLDMLQRGESLRSELLREVRPEELKAILELCLHMKKGNLSMPTQNPHRAIVTTLANRNISLSNNTKWILEYSKILYSLERVEKKVQKDINRSKNVFLQSFDMAYKREGRLKRVNALRKALYLSQYH